MRVGYKVTIACPSCGKPVERTLTLAPLAVHGQCEKCWPWEPDHEVEASVRTIEMWLAGQPKMGTPRVTLLDMIRDTAFDACSADDEEVVA